MSRVITVVWGVQLRAARESPNATRATSSGMARPHARTVATTAPGRSWLSATRAPGSWAARQQGAQVGRVRPEVVGGVDGEAVAAGPALDRPAPGVEHEVGVGVERRGDGGDPRAARLGEEVDGGVDGRPLGGGPHPPGGLPVVHEPRGEGGAGGDDPVPQARRHRDRPDEADGVDAGGQQLLELLGLGVRRVAPVAQHGLVAEAGGLLGGRPGPRQERLVEQVGDHEPDQPRSPSGEQLRRPAGVERQPVGGLAHRRRRRLAHVLGAVEDARDGRDGHAREAGDVADRGVRSAAGARCGRQIGHGRGRLRPPAAAARDGGRSAAVTHRGHSATLTARKSTWPVMSVSKLVTESFHACTA